MTAQYSLKSLAGAVLERTIDRTLSAQFKKEAAQYPHIAQKLSNFYDSDLEKIRTWLFGIGEPEEDHHLVLDKCKSNPQALGYFLKHANGEFEPGYSVADESRIDDRVRCADCKHLSGGYCQRYAVTNRGIKYRPEKNTPKRCSQFKTRSL